MKLLYYISRFWEIRAIEQKLFLISVIMCIFYSIIFSIFPVKFYQNLFKSLNCKNGSSSKENYYLFLSKKTIFRTSLLIPWELNCVVKSLSFKYLLNYCGLNSSIIIEAYKDVSCELKLHAYVTYNNNAVFLNRKRNSGIQIPVHEIE